MFQLTTEEAGAMRSQTVIASRRNIRYQPYAFTEHGVAMLSAVLKSDHAVRMSILMAQPQAERLRDWSQQAGSRPPFPGSAPSYGRPRLASIPPRHLPIPTE